MSSYLQRERNLCGGQCPPYWDDQTKNVGKEIAQNITDCIFQSSECPQF
ncbi:hypothetical protein [Chamaesiphon minutus]|nr:hypothetical protein [Chamaesiphon minutus]